MPPFHSKIDSSSASFRRNRDEMLGLVQQLRDLEHQAREKSAARAARFHDRGQLLPRERIAHLLDPGAPVLELGTISGHDPDDPAQVPGGAMLVVIGYVSGTRCVVCAHDSGIDAGAFTPAGGRKLIRAEDIALENRIPLVLLNESAGGNLLTYRVEGWSAYGRMFANQAKLSAAGIPVITVLHGSGTAGGAYIPGMSDVVIGVRGRGRAFLAGPPLLKAATGEIADAETLGGVTMHATESGLVEHVAEDDADALRICREVVARMHWNSGRGEAARSFAEPAYDPDELAGVVPVDYRQGYDVREVLARLSDGSDLLEFKPGYGPQIVCAEAEIHGHPVAFVANNGAIDNPEAGKATHFIQRCGQLGTPLVFLQNITGYMVGTASEKAGMIKNGSKMLQAVSTVDVPRFTVMIGASFGAGNYGMCGEGLDPRLLVTWPNARFGIMGAQQAARTMRVVAEERAIRSGQPLDEEAMAGFEAHITTMYEAQESAFVVSGRGCDDGMIDPRDTRRFLGFSLGMAADTAVTHPRPVSFAVGRI